MSNAVKSTVEQLVEPFLDENGFELVDIEYVKEGKNWFLRLYVDKPGGIDIDDCGTISEYLSARLDEADPIPNAYFLEVSSPGAERPLKKPADFVRAINRNVFVTTADAVSGLTQFEGLLVSYDDQNTVIQSGKTKYTIPTDKISKARLAVTF